MYYYKTSLWLAQGRPSLAFCLLSSYYYIVMRKWERERNSLTARLDDDNDFHSTPHNAIPSSGFHIHITTKTWAKDLLIMVFNHINNSRQAPWTHMNVIKMYTFRLYGSHTGSHPCSSSSKASFWIGAILLHSIQLFLHAEVLIVPSVHYNAFLISIIGHRLPLVCPSITYWGYSTRYIYKQLVLIMSKLLRTWAVSQHSGTTNQSLSHHKGLP